MKSVRLTMLLLVFTLMAGAAFGMSVAEQEAEPVLDGGLIDVQAVSTGVEVQAGVAVEGIIRDQLVAILPKS